MEIIYQKNSSITQAESEELETRYWTVFLPDQKPIPIFTNCVLGQGDVLLKLAKNTTEEQKQQNNTGLV